MAGKAIHEYKIKFSAETKEFEQDVKHAAKMLEQELYDKMEASDKMNHLKGITEYLHKLDAALTDFTAKHGENLFAEKFGGLDEGLRTSFEKMFKVALSELGKLDEIRNNLFNVSNDEQGMATLKEYETVIKNVYAALGKPIKLNSKKFENKVADIKNALSNLALEWVDVVSNISNGIGFGGEAGFAKTSEEIQAEIDKLQGQVEQYKSLKKQLQHLAEENTKFAQGEQLSNEFAIGNTGKDLLELIKLWKRLNAEHQKFIKSGDTSSVEYFENFSKLTETALKLQKRQASMSEKGRDKLDTVKIGKSTLGDMWDDAYLDAEDFLKEHTDNLNKIPQTIGKIVTETESQMAELQRAMRPKSSGDGVESLYKQLDDLLIKFADLQKRFSTMKFDDPDLDKVEAEIESLKNSILGLAKTDDQLKETSGLLEDFAADDSLKKDDILTKLCNVLGVDLPADLKAAKAQMQEFLALAKTYSGMEYISENDANAGIKKLEEMKAELIELTNQGKLTITEFEKFTSAFDSTVTHLRGMDHAAHSGSGEVDYVQKLKDELRNSFADIDFEASDKYKEIFEQLQDGTLEYTRALSKAKNVYADLNKKKQKQGVREALALLGKEKASYEDLITVIKAYKDAATLAQDEDGGEMSMARNKLRAKLAFGNMTDLIDSDNFDQLLRGKKSVEDIALLLKPHLDTSNLKKEQDAITNEFEKYLDKLEQDGKFDLLNKSDSANYNQVLAEIKNGTLTTVDQCIAKFEELTASTKVTNAYNDVFDVLTKIGDKWKDLDTVDSAIGSMPLSDIDAYIQKLESLIKLIESVDPNFQHGDKTEYDGAVKTLEKMKELSSRTKLTDEFKNTINQFEQLGKFEWSDELTNGYLKILNDIRNGTYKTIGQCVAKFNELSTAANKPTMDVATAFRELVKHISNSHSSPATIFDHLEGTTLKVSDNLKEILQALNLIDSQGKVSLSSLKSGFTNLGGFVSDQYTMIARPGHYIGKIKSIQPKLQAAQQEGAQIGAIFDIIEDKAKNVIYEIQNTVPGKSVFGHHSNKTNPDVLNASAEHIEGLVNTLQILTKNGLFIDWGGDNVLYDSQKGFSVIDMGDKGDKFFTVSSQNTLQENLDRMVKEMFKYASLDMQQALKDNVVKNLYASAQKFDASIVNPYAPKQTRTAKDAQVASAKTAAAVQREEDAHEDNTAAIKAENDALQAQIELKKKAQSMKWEVFATDDSLSALKQAAGMQTLGQLEGFWKKSNYEKQIDFHEISESDAKQIFKDKLPKGLASKWYSSADFLAKSQLENEILADPEIRNAAMSYFWHIFKNSYVASKHPNIKTFDDFINNEFTMYRGDQAPLIYDPSSKLSFSINESTANGFNSNLGTIKIKPRDTIGNAGSVFTSELETFAPSEQTSWFQKNREAFADFYAKQTKEMQKELDAGFVNFEKKRISDIIGDNLSTMTHKALQSSYWQHNVADDLKNGIVPNQLVVPTDGSDYAQFATMYNGLSDTMKRFVMFFARMDDLSASLPKPFSISVPTAGGGFKYGKNAVGAGAELFNAVLNDPEGRHQHIARLTGEKAFNLMGITPAEINAVADAHERNAQAINAEAQAQKDLNSLQDRYDMVMDDLWDSAVDADGSKHNDLSKLWSQLYDVQHSDQDLVNQGLYTQKSTGQSVDATDLFQLVVDIESKYNENLDYVKDYLKQVYSGIGFEGMVPQPISAYESTKTKTYEAAKSAYKSGNQREYFKLLGVLNHLNDIDAASDEDIAAAQYTDADTGRRYDISKILGMVKSIEDAYGENLDYVYDYLKQVYGESTIDDAVDKLQKNDTRTERRPATKYTVEDYQNAYAAAPSDMQEAIDDLAVFQQRYEQLYALTNQRPIEFMFPGKPTLNEAEEVMAIFDEFKAKQQQILHLQLLDYEGNKEQIQELQAEAVGLQNKLRGASLGENADLSEYKMTYGFIDDQDADRFKKLVDMVESVHTVMNDLTRIGEHKMSLIPQEMQDMLDSDTGDAAEQFMAQQAKQVQSAKAAAQQADASVAASKKRLQTEQDITAEKQRQASIDDQQATQTTTDAATNQNVQAEVAALETLNQKIEQVKFAVALKTSAFEQEAITVNKVVNEEIVALEKLKTLLTEIQNSLQVIFAANNWNIGDINTQQSKTSSNAMPNILEAIKSTLEQIYGVLSKTNGVEADNKNSVKVKKPAVENKPIDSDAYKTLAAKIPDDLAKDGTLQQILGAVNIIAKRPKDSENTDLANLSAALLVASTELKNAANGIIEQKKKAQGDTSVAQARIGNKDEYVQIKSAALGSLGDRALDSEVTEMQALANGVVKVTGWLKVAEDAWEGFTVQINKANEASKLAFSTNSKAAKQAAAQAKKLQESGDDEDDLNIKKYNPEETKDLAQEKIAKYTAEGKVATVQFKDSGRYTITTLEKIGGLTKRIFQTFDENDQMIERTTATMSNATLMKVQELQQVAQFGFDNNLIKEDNEIYKAFKNASDALETMNQAYNQADQLSQDQINNWNLQIDAVIKLGKEVQKLVAKSNNPAIDMKANKRAHGATPVINAQSKFNTLGARANPYIDSGWSDVSNAYQQYATALKNLINLQNQFQNGKEPNDAQKIQFNQLKEACSAAHKELKKLVDTADKFNAATDSNTRKDIFGDVNVNDRNSRAEALKSYVQEVYGAKAVVGKFNGDMTELQFTIKNTDGTITNMTAAFNSAKTQIGALHGETKKATTIFDELGLKFKELWRYAAARMGIDELFQAVRKGVEYVREIDAALTDLKKVTDETDATYAKFLQTMSQTAGQVGSTVAELTQMAAEWSRLGYSLEEAGMLAESTAVLLNVSEFDDATTASEALISTMQAFGYAADESQHVVDILNEVGNNYAVSSDGLATALQDSASSLMTAGASLEESVALIAAANKVVQDPNSVGKQYCRR